MSRAFVRSKGKRLRRRNFAAYCEKVAGLYAEGRTVSAIAAVTGTPEKLVRDVIHYAETTDEPQPLSESEN